MGRQMDKIYIDQIFERWKNPPVDGEVWDRAEMKLLIMYLFGELENLNKKLDFQATLTLLS